MTLFVAKLVILHTGFIKVTHICRVRALSMTVALQEIMLRYCQRGVIVSIEIDNMHAKYRSAYFASADEPKVKNLH